jgi:hypothetical protein
MSEVRRRPAGSYREKTLVLCQYRYLVRDHLGTRWVPDAVMVRVEFSDQIAGAVEVAVSKLSSQAWGPRMLECEMTGYVTSSGKETF